MRSKGLWALGLFSVILIAGLGLSYQTYPQIPASYVIWTDGTTYYAKDGATGQIAYSNTNATTLIQAVIDVLIDGGKIVLGEGQYNVDTRNIPSATPAYSVRSCFNIDNDNVVIQGSGRNSTIIYLNDNQPSEDHVSVFFLDSVKNIVISDLTIDYNKDHQTVVAPDLAVNWEAIDTYHTNNTIIERCRIINTVGDGVDFDWDGIASNGVVQNCLFANLNGSAVHGDDFTVINCKCVNSGEGNFRSAFSPRHGYCGLVNVRAINCYRGIMTTAEAPVSIVGGYVEGGTQTDDYHGTVYLQHGIVTVDGLTINQDTSRVGLSLHSSLEYVNIIGLTIYNSNGNYAVRCSRDNTILRNMLLIGAGSARGIQQADSATNCRIYNNQIINFGTPINFAYADVLIRHNDGYVTENAGNATLAAVTSSIVVNHGCAYTPTLGDIQVTPSRDLGNCTYYWMDTITATQFTIRVGAGGAARNIDKTVYFLWSVRRH